MQIKRVEFLRTWQEKGPPTEYWLTALFEPGDFLIAILYIASMDCGEPFHQLKLGTISLLSPSFYKHRRVEAYFTDPKSKLFRLMVRGHNCVCPAAQIYVVIGLSNYSQDSDLWSWYSVNCWPRSDMVQRTL